jgi:lambda family phage portal protein
MATKPLLNFFDRVVAAVDPERGLRRYGARSVLNQVQASGRAHEAGESGRMRKFATDGLGPNSIVGQGAAALRAQARHMERNGDIGRGILKTLVNNTVGPNGIGVEPQPRRRDGSIHTEYAEALRVAYTRWCRKPEVTGLFSLSQLQRMKANAWLRDGEVFTQHIVGAVPGLQHFSRVPYSQEVFEADFVPMDLSDGETLVQGVEKNAWGRPVALWVYKGNPKESATLLAGKAGLKRVPFERITHLARRDRIGQLRGISEFASVFNRLQDIKEYEDSERIAAKVAAALTAYVKKTSGPEGYDATTASIDPATGQPRPRQLNMAPGMIIDGLAVGEEIGLIDSKRPNPNVVTFRQGQLRATAAGVGASYSSIAKSYDGTFSAQRQELVESWVNYATLTDEFVCMDVEPSYSKFVMACHLSGVVPMPPDLMPDTWDDALYIAQSMPWIDPLKEANAWVTLVQAGFASEVEVLRKRGVNPRDLLEQVRNWRKEVKGEDGPLVFNSDAAHIIGKALADTEETPPPDPREATAQQ